VSQPDLKEETPPKKGLKHTQQNSAKNTKPLPCKKEEEAAFRETAVKYLLGG
jgi:hypothetical protein